MESQWRRVSKKTNNDCSECSRGRKVKRVKSPGGLKGSVVIDAFLDGTPVTALNVSVVLDSSASENSVDNGQ